MNALLYGIPKYLMNKLQQIQNNAPQIFTKGKRLDHITPIVARLHWLAIEKRVDIRYCWQPSRYNMAWPQGTSVTSSDHISLLAPSVHCICICSINLDPGLHPMELYPSRYLLLTNGTRCPSTCISYMNLNHSRLS